MTERTKSVILFWVLFALLMLGAWYMTRAAQPTQGAAAMQNLAALHPVAPSALVIPMLVIPPPSYTTNWLVWDYPQTNWATVSNFRVYRSDGYTNLFNTNWFTGKTLSNRVVNPHASKYTYAVTAIGSNGVESGFSNLAYLPVPPKTNLVQIITGTNLSWSTNGIKGPWKNVSTNFVVVTNFGGKSQLWRGSSVHETHTWK